MFLKKKIKFELNPQSKDYLYFPLGNVRFVDETNHSSMSYYYNYFGIDNTGFGAGSAKGRGSGLYGLGTNYGEWLLRDRHGNGQN